MQGSMTGGLLGRMLPLGVGYEIILVVGLGCSAQVEVPPPRAAGGVGVGSTVGLGEPLVLGPGDEAFGGDVAAVEGVGAFEHGLAGEDNPNHTRDVWAVGGAHKGDAQRVFGRGLVGA